MDKDNLIQLNVNQSKVEQFTEKGGEYAPTHINKPVFSAITYFDMPA